MCIKRGCRLPGEVCLSEINQDSIKARRRPFVTPPQKQQGKPRIVRNQRPSIKRSPFFREENTIINLHS